MNGFSGRIPSAQIWSLIKSFKRNKHKVSGNDLKFQWSSNDAMSKLCPPSCSPNFTKSIEDMLQKETSGSRTFFPGSITLSPLTISQGPLPSGNPLFLDLTKWLLYHSQSTPWVLRLSLGNFQWYLRSRCLLWFMVWLPYRPHSQTRCLVS